MPAITWDDSLRTGIDAIDRQHRELFDQANKLFDNLGGQKDPKKIKESMQFLVKYVEVHFEAEQRSMKIFGYPKRMAHAFEHDTLTKELHRLVEEFINGGNMLLPTKLGNLVSSWLLQHIKKSDMEFVQFLKTEKKVPAINKLAR